MLKSCSYGFGITCMTACNFACYVDSEQTSGLYLLPFAERIFTSLPTSISKTLTCQGVTQNQASSSNSKIWTHRVVVCLDKSVADQSVARPLIFH